MSKKKLSFIETTKLTVYLEFLGRYANEITTLGGKANEAVSYGAITENEKEEIIKSLNVKLKAVDVLQREIFVEIESRLGRDLSFNIKVNFNSLDKIYNKYPYLKLTAAQYKNMRDEELKAKAVEELKKKKEKKEGKILTMKPKKS